MIPVMKCVITERNSDIGQQFASVMFRQSRKQIGHYAERYVCNEQVICMYICVHVCKFIRICMYIYVYIYTYIYTYIYICVLRLHVCICMLIQMYCIALLIRC